MNRRGIFKCTKNRKLMKFCLLLVRRYSCSSRPLNCQYQAGPWLNTVCGHSIALSIKIKYSWLWTEDNLGMLCLWMVCLIDKVFNFKYNYSDYCKYLICPLQRKLKLSKSRLCHSEFISNQSQRNWISIRLVLNPKPNDNLNRHELKYYP